MTSNFDDQLKKIDQLIVHGKFKEADEIITKAIKKKGITKDAELQFLAYKSELEMYFANYDESIRLADKILRESKGIDNPLLTCDALTWKACSSFWKGSTSDCLESFEKGLEILSAVKNHPTKSIAKRKAQLLTWQSFMIQNLGDYEKAKTLVEEASPYSERSGYKNLVSLNYIVTSNYFRKIEELQMSREYIERGFDLATELGNDFLLGFSYSRMAQHKLTREPEEAEEFYHKADAHIEKAGSKVLLFYKNDQGVLYSDLLRYDKAFECFQETIAVIPLMSHIINSNMGYLYFKKYDLEKAQKYYLESLKYSEEINDRYILPNILYMLIEITLKLNNPAKANEYFKRLKELLEETGFERINQIYQLASTLLLKASGNMSDLVKAAELLESLLSEERFWLKSRLETMYSFLEIRLKELLLTPDEGKIKEVQKRLHHLEVEAENQQAKWLLANIYRLQSQLDLIKLNVQQAIELLDKAETIAEEIDVILLKNEIENDKEKINNQLAMLQKYQEQQAPIKETIKLVSLEETAQSIKQDTILEVRDEETGEIIEYRKLFALKI